MASWKLRVTNRSGSNVNVMIFQTVPDDLMTDSYCTAWRVVEAPHPGDFNVELPEAFHFYVIDQPNGGERKSGPYAVSYGQEVKVLQKNGAEPPTVTAKFDDNVPKDQIKVTNMAGNAQPLEMALFKKGSKVVCYKDIVPNTFLNMAIKPKVYLAVISGVKQGQEFPTNSIIHNDFQQLYIMSGLAMFKPGFELLKSKPAMNIQLTQESSGEYVFTDK